MSENVLALIQTHQAFGAAYYNAEEQTLFMMQDQLTKDPRPLIESLRLQVSPETILIPSKSTQDIHDACEHPFPLTVESQINLRPMAEFAASSGKRKLLSLAFEGVQDNQLHLDAVIDTDCNPLALGAAGAMLTNLRNNMHISKIKIFSLSNFMQLSLDTFNALAIFANEQHPNRQTQRQKEGLSLYGLCQKHLKSKMGPQILRKWLLCPLVDIRRIQERQEIVQLFTESRWRLLGQEIRNQLKLVKKIPSVLNQLKEHSTVQYWVTMDRFIQSSLRISEILAQFDHDLFSKIKSQDIQETLVNTMQMIEKMIDFDQSVLEERLVIKPFVDPDLDAKKTTYASLESLLNTVAQDLGYLVAIPNQELTEIEALGLEFMFQTEGVQYFKNVQMHQLDQEVGDIHSEIVDLELEHMQAMRDIVLARQSLFEDLSLLLGQLDVLLCFAQCAIEYRYVCPKMVHTATLELKGSRHAIVEQVQELFVKNDCNLKEAILLTGANGSGKTVFCTQVGLIVFMAHVGMFVPCDEASIGLTPAIHTSVQIAHSVSAGTTSSWARDLQSIYRLLLCKSRDLVLLDEFGNGTDPNDGIGIFCAVVNALKHQTRLIASTHYQECYANGHISDIQFKYMRCEWRDELVHLFRLEDGIAQQSFAVECARKHQMKIADRMQAIRDCLVEGAPIPMENDQQEEEQPEPKRKRESKSQAVRNTVKKAFVETLTTLLDQMKEDNVAFDPNQQAEQLEQCLFDAFSESDDITPQYKSKFRTLQYNLKDNANTGLRSKIFATKELTLEQLVRLSPEALNDLVKAKKEQAQQEALKQVFKPKQAPEIKSEPKIAIKTEAVSAKSTASLDDMLSKINTPTGGLDDLLSKMPEPEITPLTELVAKVERPIIKTETTEEVSLDDLLAEIKGPEPKKKEPASHNWVSRPPEREMCFQGQINMPQVADFNVSAFQIGGVPVDGGLWASKILKSPSLHVEGRIRHKDVNSYLATRYQRNKLILIIEFTSQDPQFDVFCNYMVERARYGVIQVKAPIKDFYLIPLLANETPGFEGHSLEPVKHNRLLGVLVMTSSYEELTAPSEAPPSMAPQPVPVSQIHVQGPVAPLPIPQMPMHQPVMSMFPPQISVLHQMQPLNPVAQASQMPVFPMQNQMQPVPQPLNPNLIGGLLAQFFQNTNRQQ
ncbi:muts domain V-domain-containing protein [Gorgonomyces haynaldii]|nr:muts domain V-domain-containing protein [Gorgonomyces haynaldii]